MIMKANCKMPKIAYLVIKEINFIFFCCHSIFYLDFAVMKQGNLFTGGGAAHKLRSVNHAVM